METAHNPRRAAAIRDAATRRVRLMTAAAIAGATALTGIFAAMAAGSTHFVKRTVTPHAPKAARTAKKAAPATTRTVTAPTPALVPNGSSAPAPSSSSSQAPAVVQSSAPPVVVSGGS